MRPAALHPTDHASPSPHRHPAPSRTGTPQSLLSLALAAALGLLGCATPLPGPAPAPAPAPIEDAAPPPAQAAASVPAPAIAAATTGDAAAVPEAAASAAQPAVPATLATDAAQPAAQAASQAAAPAAVPAAPSGKDIIVATPLPADSAASSVPLGDEEPAAAAGVPSDPLRPEEVLSLEDEAARRDLWQRIRRGFAMADLDNALVRSRERWYADRPDYVQRMTERGSRYLFHVVEEVERRGLPTELALLPFIESAFNPQAMSVARASGMWQFIPSTGRLYDLKQNVFRDDRRDVLASTRAALDYLEKLHGMFGDWHLALAAYNWGEGNVQRAIARNQRSRKPTNYSSLRMPSETRYYVPKLQAVKNIVADPQAFGLTLPPLENHPYFIAVPIERDMDADLAAGLADMTMDEFRTLNPSLNKPVILAAGTPRLLLPYDNANTFLRNLRTHKGPLATWTAWVAPRTMHPKDVAEEVGGITEAELRDVNDIPRGMLVRAGSALLVPRADAIADDVSEQLAHGGSLMLAPDAPNARKVVVRARRGDTVRKVALRMGVQPAHVAYWNNVSVEAPFARGARVVVYKTIKAVRAQSRKRPRAVRHTATTQRATAAKAGKPVRKAARKASAKRSSSVARR